MAGIICPMCGAEASLDAKECFICGANLAFVQRPEPQPAVNPQMQAPQSVVSPQTQAAQPQNWAAGAAATQPSPVATAQQTEEEEPANDGMEYFVECPESFVRTIVPNGKVTKFFCGGCRKEHVIDNFVWVLESRPIDPPTADAANNGGTGFPAAGMPQQGGSSPANGFSSAGAPQQGGFSTGGSFQAAAAYPAAPAYSSAAAYSAPPVYSAAPAPAPAAAGNHLILEEMTTGFQIPIDKRGGTLGRYGDYGSEFFQGRRLLVVSGEHCRITYELDNWVIYHISRTNSTKYDGQELEPNEGYRLENGKILTLAKAVSFLVRIV